MPPAERPHAHRLMRFRRLSRRLRSGPIKPAAIKFRGAQGTTVFVVRFGGMLGAVSFEIQFARVLNKQGRSARDAGSVPTPAERVL